MGVTQGRAGQGRGNSLCGGLKSTSRARLRGTGREQSEQRPATRPSYPRAATSEPPLCGSQALSSRVRASSLGTAVGGRESRPFSQLSEARAELSLWPPKSQRGEEGIRRQVRSGGAARGGVPIVPTVITELKSPDNIPRPQDPSGHPPHLPSWKMGRTASSPLAARPASLDK